MPQTQLSVLDWHYKTLWCSNGVDSLVLFYLRRWQCSISRHGDIYLDVLIKYLSLALLVKYVLFRRMLSNVSCSWRTSSGRSTSSWKHHHSMSWMIIITHKQILHVRFLPIREYTKKSGFHYGFSTRNWEKNSKLIKLISTLSKTL